MAQAITYTRTYTYQMPDDLVEVIKDAPRMYEAIILLKRATNGALRLETMSCLCKTIRGLEVNDFSTSIFPEDFYDKKAILDEGYQAQANGKNMVRDNPYPEMDSRHWGWRTGFCQAFKDSN